MPNRIVIQNAPESLKTQVYGSDIDSPLQVENGSLSITGTVAIDSSTPVSVSVDGITNITIANSLTIASLPTVVFDQPVEVSVVTPVTIAAIPEVTIISLPTVVFDQPVEVSVVTPITIVSIPEVTIVNSPSVIIMGRANINEVTNLSFATRTVQTDLYDVSDLSDFSYAFLSNVNATAYLYISPTTNPIIAITSPINSITLLANVPTSETPDRYLFYTYAMIDAGAADVSKSVTIYMQGLV